MIRQSVRSQTGLCRQTGIQGVGAGARARPWGGVSPFKIYYSIAFKYQSITGRPPLGEILYPSLAAVSGIPLSTTRKSKNQGIIDSILWL